MIKTFIKLGVEGNFMNLIKDINKNPTANFVLNGEKLKALPWKYGELCVDNPGWLLMF